MNEPNVTEQSQDAAAGCAPATGSASLRGCKEDHRQPKGGWADGNYMCRCWWCGQLFTGDKRATQCANCAYMETPNDKSSESAAEKSTS